MSEMQRPSCRRSSAADTAAAAAPLLLLRVIGDVLVEGEPTHGGLVLVGIAFKIGQMRTHNSVELK